MCVCYMYVWCVLCVYVMSMLIVCMYGVRMLCACAFIYDARKDECALLAYILPEPYIVCVCDRMYIMLTPRHALA